MLNISASPYHLGKGQAREEMLATRARDGLCAVAYCNLVGGQDELVFDGRSAVFGPDGTVLARAASFAEELLVCDLELDASVHERLRDSRLRRGRRHRVHPPVTIELPLGGERAAVAPSVALPPAGQTAELWGALRLGLIDYVRKNGFERVLLGLSGGIDSALVAALAADALGADRVEAVSMPTRYNSEGTRSDARLVAERLGIAFREVAIEDLRLSFEGALPGTSGLAAENLQARIRGVLLMTLSNQHGWLVLTTGNKSETAVGYSTLYGDSAGGFAPIKDVPKTLVFALARYVNEQAGPRADPGLDHRAPALGRAARRPARRPVAAALRAARPADRGLRRGRPLARGDRPARPGDARGGEARRPPRRSRGVQAPPGAARDQGAPQGLRPRPAPADHEPLRPLTGSPVEV